MPWNNPFSVSRCATTTVPLFAFSTPRNTLRSFQTVTRIFHAFQTATSAFRVARTREDRSPAENTTIVILRFRSPKLAGTRYFAGFVPRFVQKRQSGVIATRKRETSDWTITWLADEACIRIFGQFRTQSEAADARIARVIYPRRLFARKFAES